jgi:NADPH2:quinone reductase
MKAALIRSHGNHSVINIEEVPSPVPCDGEVLIAVSAAGVLFNDVMVREGWHPHVPPLPLVLGCEVAGSVIAVGHGVSDEWIGKRVATSLPGAGYAEYAVAPAATLLELPTDIDNQEAISLLINAPTAIVMLQEAAQIKSGDVVMVNAASGAVGTLLLDCARALGARAVIGTASSSKLKQVAERCDAAIDYGLADWTEQVLAVAPGGVDVVLESVGGDIGTRSFACLRIGGTMVQYGLASRLPTSVDPNMIITRGIKYIGFGLPHFPRERWIEASQFAIDLKRKGALSLTPSHVYALADVSAAHEALDSRATHGKIVLDVLG